MRNLDLNDLRVFVRVVDRGKFAAAASELGVPTSTVSRAIARLEASTGARLFQRTSRSLHATGEGRAIYASIREAVGALERATRAIEPATRAPKGLLRVTAPTDIGAMFLADVAVAFGTRYPLVQVELTLTNRSVNVVNEGFDVALRAAQRLPDSTLVVRKLGDIEHAVYASPRYVEHHGAPSSPADLAHHRCIVFRGRDLAKTWSLRAGNQATDIVIQASIGGDDFSFLRAAVIAGGGLALLPRLVCAKDEAAGRLVRVLPSFSAKGAGLYLLYPSSAHVPARVSAFRDCVVDAFHAQLVAAP